MKKLSGLGKSAIYARIDQKARDLLLPPRKAALAVARDLGVAVHRYATEEELAGLRPHRAASGDLPRAAAAPPEPESRAGRKRPRPASTKKSSNSVFVIHGRNKHLLAALHSFLRAVGVTPVEWPKAITLSKKPSPYLNEILEATFKHVQAVVVLLSGDDEVVLRKEFRKPSDSAEEKKVRNQPRQNVLFEAGMAVALLPERTLFIQVGKVKVLSDIAGRHLLHLNNT
jgi:predicted nucleotide-binding protein